MISWCLENHAEFGVIFSQGGRLSTTGTTAYVENVLQEFPDGKRDILCIGKRRFQVGKLLDRKPYLEAEVIFIEDQNEDTAVLTTLRQKGEGLLNRYSRLIQKPIEAHWYQEASFEEFSFILSEMGQYTTREQQRLLEMVSTTLRLKRALQTLEARVTRHELGVKLVNELGPGDYDHILN